MSLRLHRGISTCGAFITTVFIMYDYPQLCETYSSSLYLPATVDNSVITGSAKFRSKERLPVLSYYYKPTQVNTPNTYYTHIHVLLVLRANEWVALLVYRLRNCLSRQISNLSTYFRLTYCHTQIFTHFSTKIKQKPIFAC